MGSFQRWAIRYPRKKAQILTLSPCTVFLGNPGNPSVGEAWKQLQESMLINPGFPKHMALVPRATSHAEQVPWWPHIWLPTELAQISPLRRQIQGAAPGLCPILVPTRHLVLSHSFPSAEQCRPHPSSQTHTLRHNNPPHPLMDIISYTPYTKVLSPTILPFHLSPRPSSCLPLAPSVLPSMNTVF